MSDDRYPFQEVEKRWRNWWHENEIHDVDLDTDEEKCRYILVMFSYPSSSKLHIGHWWNYAPTDSYARFLRMNGYKIFEPMGFDSFGLPAENYAIKVGTHPKQTTEESIEFIEQQLDEIGAMYDWRYKVVTSRPEYYRWTQWLFLKLYNHGLAYQKEGLINWCPSCQTVLANEQAEGGECERCHSTVIQRKMTQWYFKVTEYADKLLEGLDEIDWPESTKKRQQNWIGRSEGANIKFTLEKSPDKYIETFTTRPDTLFGVTYVVLAPENDLAIECAEKYSDTPEQLQEVKDYIQRSMQTNEVERTSTTREKTGVFTGAYAMHPLTGKRLPIWVADYVLGSYGTGAVMAVPAHDQRDFEFAEKYELPIQVVIRPMDGLLEAEEMREAYEGPGIMMNSEQFSGVRSEDGKKVIAEKLQKLNLGGPEITYRIRDWSISRQRYWGAPIPLVHCEKCGAVPVPESDLPVLLPDEIKEYRPKGSSPLGALSDWMDTTCPKCGGQARRDPDTMDTYVCSSFYHLRYLAADDHEQPFHAKRMKKWLPIHTYVGGPEHSTGHLIYFRFITRFLHDIGLVPVAEPAQRLIHQGIITHAGSRMSKSKGNVVNPDTFVANYGSDVFRMYLMFMGDYSEGGDWSDEGITGVDRFINRIWRLATRLDGMNVDDTFPVKGDYTDDLYRTLHRTIEAVGSDLEGFAFNTAISRIMELINATYLWIGEKEDAATFKALGRLLKVVARLIAPLAPHFGEEIWHRLGGEGSVFDQSWPEYDPKAMVAETITLIVQVNGKVRDRIEVPTDADQETLKTTALASEKIQEMMQGKQLRKAIVVPGKLVNLVIG